MRTQTIGVFDSADTTPRAREKRAQIRVAAHRLFLQHGFLGTSMDAVSETAGISKQTLYRYYDSKETLFADIIYQATLGRSPFYLPAVPDDLVFASREDLEALFVRIAIHLTEKFMDPAYLGIMRLVIAETPRVPHLAQLYRDTVINQGIEFLTSLLRRAHDSHVVNVPHPELAVRLFIGALLVPVFSEGLLGSDATPRMPMRDELAMLVHLFVASLADTPR